MAIDFLLIALCRPVHWEGAHKPLDELDFGHMGKGWYIFSVKKINRRNFLTIYPEGKSRFYHECALLEMLFFFLIEAKLHFCQYVVVILGKNTHHFSAYLGALLSSPPLLLNTWLEAGLRLQLHPPSRYHGNAIWAYQDLKPKDILDNNTIAAQRGYLRDLDLRGEIWGVAD